LNTLSNTHFFIGLNHYTLKTEPTKYGGTYIHFIQ
jgi:hypothetical protein